jgi:hypothetical protein
VVCRSDQSDHSTHQLIHVYHRARTDKTHSERNESAFASNGGLIVTTSALMVVHRDLIITLAARSCSLDERARFGCLMFAARLVGIAALRMVLRRGEGVADRYGLGFRRPNLAPVRQFSPRESALSLLATTAPRGIESGEHYAETRPDAQATRTPASGCSRRRGPRV